MFAAYKKRKKETRGLGNVFWRWVQLGTEAKELNICSGVCSGRGIERSSADLNSLPHICQVVRLCKVASNHSKNKAGIDLGKVLSSKIKGAGNASDVLSCKLQHACFLF